MYVYMYMYVRMFVYTCVHIQAYSSVCVRLVRMPTKARAVTPPKKGEMRLNDEAFKLKNGQGGPRRCRDAKRLVHL